MSTEAENLIEEISNQYPSVTVNIHSSAKIWHIRERLDDMNDREKEIAKLPQYRRHKPLSHLTILAHKHADKTSLGIASYSPHDPDENTGSVADYKNSETRTDYFDYWKKTKNNPD